MSTRTRSTVLDVIVAPSLTAVIPTAGWAAALHEPAFEVNQSHCRWQSIAEGRRLRAGGGAGGLHSLAIPHSNQILSWGANQNGLLGHGSHASTNVAHPTLIPDVYAQSVRPAVTPAPHVEASARALSPSHFCHCRASSRRPA